MRAEKNGGVVLVQLGRHTRHCIRGRHSLLEKVFHTEDADLRIHNGTSVGNRGRAPHRLVRGHKLVTCSFQFAEHGLMAVIASRQAQKRAVDDKRRCLVVGETGVERLSRDRAAGARVRDADRSRQVKHVRFTEQRVHVADYSAVVELSFVDRSHAGAHTAVVIFLCAKHFHKDRGCGAVSRVTCNITHRAYLPFLFRGAPAYARENRRAKLL